MGCLGPRCHVLDGIQWHLWHNGRSFARDPKGRGFESWPVRFHVTALGKLLTRMSLCHQAVEFGTGRWAVTLFGWEGNLRPGRSNGSLYRRVDGL